MESRTTNGQQKSIPYTIYINHDCFFFPPLPLSCTLIRAIKHQSLFIYFSYLGSKGLEWRSGGVKEWGMEGWRTEGAAASCVWFTRLAACLNFSRLCCELVVQ